MPVRTDFVVYGSYVPISLCMIQRPAMRSTPSRKAASVVYEPVRTDFVVYDPEASHEEHSEQEGGHPDAGHGLVGDAVRGQRTAAGRLAATARWNRGGGRRGHRCF